ncbi:unnamed protein product [Diamesa serratosioi]
MALVDNKGKSHFQPDPDADVQITFDDQSKINKFANYVAKLEDLKEELKIKKTELQNIEEAVEEMELMEDDGTKIQFLMGEVFVYNNLEKTQELLLESKHNKEEEIKDIENRAKEIGDIMTVLKTALYAKFGMKNIYLENDE